MRIYARKPTIVGLIPPRRCRASNSDDMATCLHVITSPEEQSC